MAVLGAALRQRTRAAPAARVRQPHAATIPLVDRVLFRLGSGLRQPHLQQLQQLGPSGLRPHHSTVVLPRVCKVHFRYTRHPMITGVRLFAVSARVSVSLSARN